MTRQLWWSRHRKESTMRVEAMAVLRAVKVPLVVAIGIVSLSGNPDRTLQAELREPARTVLASHSTVAGEYCARCTVVNEGWFGSEYWYHTRADGNCYEGLSGALQSTNANTLAQAEGGANSPGTGFAPMAQSQDSSTEDILARFTRTLLRDVRFDEDTVCAWCSESYWEQIDGGFWLGGGAHCAGGYFNSPWEEPCTKYLCLDVPAEAERSLHAALRSENAEEVIQVLAKWSSVFSLDKENGEIRTRDCRVLGGRKIALTSGLLRSVLSTSANRIGAKKPV